MCWKEMMTDIIDSVVGRRRRRRATTSIITEKERRVRVRGRRCLNEKLSEYKRLGDNEREVQVGGKTSEKETGTAKPFGGQAAPEKDTINRRNRMKLRCVRGGRGLEEVRVTESLTQEEKNRGRDCVMQTSLQTSLSASSDTR